MPKIVIVITVLDLAAIDYVACLADLISTTQIWVLSLCIEGGSVFCVFSSVVSYNVLRYMLSVFLLMDCL